jgi:F0F1-type ATP synthase membrane subunit b/b'
MNDLYIRVAIWSQVISSVVFLAALVYMWSRWILPVVMTAQDRSNRQIAEAERHRDEAKTALQTLREDIEGARHDAKLMEQRVGERADHEREALLQETTEAGERALAEAGLELERARAAAGQRLRDDLLEGALRLARQQAAQRVDAALDARLVDRFAGSLEGIAGG